mmetsp:Transcript_35465/g.81135  ORF Transcript_35465/g.81135 Transcript_35465/m.81135 type:complete len:217 (-) Transcript_35465:92-742(-)
MKHGPINSLNSTEVTRPVWLVFISMNSSTMSSHFAGACLNCSKMCGRKSGEQLRALMSNMKVATSEKLTAPSLRPTKSMLWMLASAARSMICNSSSLSSPCILPTYFHISPNCFGVIRTSLPPKRSNASCNRPIGRGSKWTAAARCRNNSGSYTSSTSRKWWSPSSITLLAVTCASELQQCTAGLDTHHLPVIALASSDIPPAYCQSTIPALNDRQ